jgi:hypothetical protein
LSVWNVRARGARKLAKVAASSVVTAQGVLGPVLVPRVARRVALDGVADAQRAMAQGTIAEKGCVEIQ